MKKYWIMSLVFVAAIVFGWHAYIIYSIVNDTSFEGNIKIDINPVTDVVHVTFFINTDPKVLPLINSMMKASMPILEASANKAAVDNFDLYAMIVNYRVYPTVVGLHE